MKELQKLLNQVENFKSLGYESHFYQWHTKRIIELKKQIEMNYILEALKELLTDEPKSIGCMFINDKAIVYLEYSAIDWSYALHFKGEDLIEVEMIEKFEGISVLFGESIGTDRDILNEICFEIHPSIIEYKKNFTNMKNLESLKSFWTNFNTELYYKYLKLKNETK